MFKKGQRIVCISKGCNWTGNNGVTEKGPEEKEIVTISGFDQDGALLLMEYPDPTGEGYDSDSFRPLNNSDNFALEVLSKALEEAREEYEVQELELV